MIFFKCIRAYARSYILVLVKQEIIIECLLLFMRNEDMANQVYVSSRLIVTPIVFGPNGICSPLKQVVEQ